ncbi:MAG: hypothetical protein ACO3FN_03870 [Vulcanococcus sp.]|jgi:hypothetical protein
MVIRFRSPAQAGFVLPLSIVGALMLLLSSLSMQGLVLQAHQVQAAVRERGQREDRLASAAQHWAAQLQGPLLCLQRTPSADWATQALAPECPPELDLQVVQQVEMGGESVHLLRWEPLAAGGLLSLRLSNSGVQRQFRVGRLGVQEVG